MESGDFFSSSVLPWRAGRTYGFFSHGFPASRGSVGRDGADLFFVTLRHHGFFIRTANADLSSRIFLSLVFFLPGRTYDVQV
jgi:hypothetical protein